MSENDITQIRVDQFSVGVIGLNQVLEDMAEKYVDKPDEETAAELLKRLSLSNYIPETARESYAKAFLRAFKRSLGKPLESEEYSGMDIKVLGQGCNQCDRLERDIMEALAETETLANFEHVRDIKEISKYGVMGVPALIINGKVMCVGKVPPKSKLVEWIKKA